MKPPIKNIFARKFTEPKSNIVPIIPIGFEMAEKKVHIETNKHFRIFISRNETVTLKMY